jgi:AcrR family transcriptional regulator
LTTLIGACADAACATATLLPASALNAITIPIAAPAKNVDLLFRILCLLSYLNIQLNIEYTQPCQVFFSMPPYTPTRDRLIDSARYLFWERGYAGASMADLLTHANVNSGSFYHFFDSKEALLREVLAGYLRALHPVVIGPALASANDPVDQIFAILEGYRGRILSTDCRYGCPLGRLALEIDPENRPAHALIAENFAGWMQAVEGCVEQLRPRLPRGTDAHALATFVLTTMEGGVMLSRSFGSIEPFDAAVRQLRAHFALLLGEKVTSTPQKRKKSAASPKRR